MHLKKQSREFVSSYCRDSVFHHLIVEFDCDANCTAKNIKDTADFYRKLDTKQDWQRTFSEKHEKFSAQHEKCSPLEGPLIQVNNSEDHTIHSVTARGVQGLLQTIILGGLSSPVLKHRVFYFSRVSRAFHPKFRFGLNFKCFSMASRNSTCWVSRLYILTTSDGESFQLNCFTSFRTLKNQTISGRIGGDADLSARGKKYAENLAKQLGGPGSAPNSPKPRLVSGTIVSS